MEHLSRLSPAKQHILVATHSWASFLAVAVLAVLLPVLSACQPSPPRTILFIAKDQATTLSLNPTRLLTTAEMARKTRQALCGEDCTARHHYIWYDGPEEVGVQLAREFLENNVGVFALVGDINSAGTALVAELAREFAIPHVSFFATDDTIFENNPLSFSYRERVSNETQALISILEHLNIHNIAMVTTDLVNYIPRWRDFLGKAQARSINVSSQYDLVRSVIDFNPTLDTLEEKTDTYDAIVTFLGSNQLNHFIQQLGMRSIDVPLILTGVGMDPETVAELAGIYTPVYSFAYEHFVELQNPQNQALQDFAQEYRIAMGYHRIDTLGPWIYDGVLLLHELISESQSPLDIPEKLLNYREKRLIGKVSFNPAGTLSEQTFVLVRTDSGTFIPLVMD